MTQEVYVKDKCMMLLFTCSILIGGSCFSGKLWANNAYRYFNLYKNSEIYKERHPEKNKNKEKPDNRGSTLDGWGNLVDPSPPPPPDNGYDEYDDEPDSGDGQGDNGDNMRSW